MSAEGVPLEGLGEFFAASGPELSVLRDALARVVGPASRVIGSEPFKSRVRRLQIETGGSRRSLIVKQLDPVLAHRSRMVVDRWLPAVDLAGLGPGLLASAAEPEGRCAWQVYEDWGDAGLDLCQDDRRRARAAVRAIAELHLRFADHALLGECRLWGGDLGMAFYGSNARDGLRALEALATVELPERGEAARQRLGARLQVLLDQERERARALEEFGGPETLVHGDLWPTNVFVLDVGARLRVRLIDWDHAAVGRFPYDLSTLLHRFPIGRRPEMLADYAEVVANRGWQLADDRALNGMFETAEWSRIASHVVWPALALLRDEAPLRSWALDALAEVNGWFDALEPLLPCERSAVA